MLAQKVPRRVIEVPRGETYVHFVALQSCSNAPVLLCRCSCASDGTKHTQRLVWGFGVILAMIMHMRWTIAAAAVFSLAPFLLPPGAPYRAATTALAQSVIQPYAPPQHDRRRAKRAPHENAAGAAKPAGSSEQQPPPRVPFTAADDAAATIPGVPDARFWGDSPADFISALPKEPGPWLALSSGGSDGAFGAGLLVGLGAAGNRPTYSVVTGVSTGALMAPFVFAGSKYDEALRDTYTKISAADVFEAGRTAESFVDSWPLKETIAKKVTPELLADIAAEYQRGRRLFVASFDLDAERPVIWNLGAIAAHGGEDGLALFRTVLLASSALPGAFPPVLVDVEANGKRFAEMHVDGGVGGQFLVVPGPLLIPSSDFRLPATQLYIVVNTGLERDFEVVDRFVPTILTQAVSAAVKVDTRLMLDIAYNLAKRNGTGFNVASIPLSFNVPSKGPFDPKYMGALFQVGYEQGRSATPFAKEPPAYPNGPQPQSSQPPQSSQNDKSGVN